MGIISALVGVEPIYLPLGGGIRMPIYSIHDPVCRRPQETKPLGVCKARGRFLVISFFNREKLKIFLILV